MRGIPLTKGFVALVDDEDFDRLAQFNWHTRMGTRGGRKLADAARKENGRSIAMHREILRAAAKTAEAETAPHQPSGAD